MRETNFCRFRLDVVEWIKRKPRKHCESLSTLASISPSAIGKLSAVQHRRLDIIAASDGPIKIFVSVEIGGGGGGLGRCHKCAAFLTVRPPRRKIGFNSRLRGHKCTGKMFHICSVEECKKGVAKFRFINLVSPDPSVEIVATNQSILSEMNISMVVQLADKLRGSTAVGGATTASQCHRKQGWTLGCIYFLYIQSYLAR